MSKQHSNQIRVCHLCMEECGTLKDLQIHLLTEHDMRHPTMNSPKVLNTDSLLQDMNSLQIRTNAVISVSVPNLPKVQRICHLCLEEYGTLKDLQNHISTAHNLSHPTTYYSNSTSGYSTSWQKSTLLNTDSLLQDMNSSQIRTNTVISASVLNLPKVQRICHLCLEEYGTLKDLQNHISTAHNLSHPTTYYSNSTSGYSTSWKFEHLLNIPKGSPKHPQSIQINVYPKTVRA